MKKYLLILLSLSLILPVSVIFSDQCDGSLEHKTYASPDGMYSYDTYGSGSSTDPYKSAIFDIISETNVLTIQTAVEGYPITKICSLGSCSSEIIVIPKTVEIIETNAFDSCKNLKTLYFLGDKPSFEQSVDVEIIALQGTVGWDKDTTSLTLYTHKNTSCSYSYYVIDGEASVFEHISGKNVIIDERTADGTLFVEICSEAFRKSNLISVNMSNSITSIGSRAFYQCESLTTAILSSNLQIIRDEAFRSCIMLNNVEFPNVWFIGFESFRLCNSFTEIYIPDSVKTLCDGAFYVCENVQNIHVGCGIDELASRVFGYSSALISVEFDTNITSIGSFAFFGSHKLTSIDISTVRVIGDSAFSGCTYLETIGSLKDIVSIGYNTFNECRSLSNVSLGSSLDSVGDYAFAQCRSMEDIYFAGEMPSFGNSVFLGSDVTVHCLDSHKSSWMLFDGKLVVDGDPSNHGNLMVIIIIMMIIGVVTYFVYKKRNSTD